MRAILITNTQVNVDRLMCLRTQHLTSCFHPLIIIILVLRMEYVLISFIPTHCLFLYI